MSTTTATATKKVHGTSVAKKTATPTMEIAKSTTARSAEGINLKSILPVLDKSLFIEKTRGGNRENVYHKELFANLSEKEKKTLRRTMRTNLESFAESFISFSAKKELNKLKNLKAAWESYYKETYRVNDLSVESILPGNAGPEKQKEVAKMLEILKSIK